MKKVIDYTGKYEAKENEQVVRANVLFYSEDDLRGFDAVCIDDSELLNNYEIEIVVNKAARKKRGTKK